MPHILLLLLFQGGPPLLTDDPGTPGDGIWEVNVAWTVERLSQETRWETPLLDLNYGVGSNTQLKIEIPWLVVDEGETGGVETGLGNVRTGVKWRFVDEEGHGFFVSTYPQLELNVSSYSERLGLVEEGTELFLPIEVQKEFEILDVNWELGYALREGSDDEWIGGMAFGRQVNADLELLAELHGGAGSSLHDGGVVYDVGFRWHIGDHEKILFSIGRRLLEDPDEPKLMAYIGLQFLF